MWPGWCCVVLRAAAAARRAAGCRGHTVVGDRSVLRREQGTLNWEPPSPPLSRGTGVWRPGSESPLATERRYWAGLYLGQRSSVLVLRGGRCLSAGEKATCSPGAAVRPAARRSGGVAGPRPAAGYAGGRRPDGARCTVPRLQHVRTPLRPSAAARDPPPMPPSCCRKSLIGAATPLCPPPMTTRPASHSPPAALLWPCGPWSRGHSVRPPLSRVET